MVRPGETWESIARDRATRGVTAAMLAIMNGSEPTNPPRVGSRIRVVVAG